MSNLLTLLGRLLATLFTADPAPLDPENLSLREWADLPAHHPSSDRAPC